MTSKRKEDPMTELYTAVRDNYEGCLPPLSDDVVDRFQWLVACGRLILPEYRFKWPQLKWWNDPDFDKYLEKFDELKGFNADRRWNLAQLMRLVANIPGDTAECGCYRAASSYLMCSVNARQIKYPRTHHVFDSFEGLSAPGDFDGEHWAQYNLAASENEAECALSEFKGAYILYKGWIPSRFQEIAGKNFAFVHLDVDIYEPTKDSIDFFYPRLNRGGILLCDDYGFTTCPGATKAIDDYLAHKPEKMIAMSSGGGFLIKETVTDNTK